MTHRFHLYAGGRPCSIPGCTGQTSPSSASKYCSRHLVAARYLGSPYGQNLDRKLYKKALGVVAAYLKDNAWAPDVLRLQSEISQSLMGTPLMVSIPKATLVSLAVYIVHKATNNLATFPHLLLRELGRESTPRIPKPRPKHACSFERLQPHIQTVITRITQ